MRGAQFVPAKSPDAAFVAFERYVREWIPLLGFSDWRVMIVRNDEVAELASCIADSGYKKILLTANGVRMHRDGHTPLQSESVAIHELVHALVWLAFNELANPAIPDDLMTLFEEQTTERIAESLLRAKYGNDAATHAIWSGCFVSVAVSPTGTQENTPQ